MCLNALRSNDVTCPCVECLDRREPQTCGRRSSSLRSDGSQGPARARRLCCCIRMVSDCLLCQTATTCACNYMHAAMHMHMRAPTSCSGCLPGFGAYAARHLLHCVDALIAISCAALQGRTATAAGAAAPTAMANAMQPMAARPQVPTPSQHGTPFRPAPTTGTPCLAASPVSVSSYRDCACCCRLMKFISSPPPEPADVVSEGSSTSVQPRGGAVVNRSQGPSSVGAQSPMMLASYCSVFLGGWSLHGWPDLHAADCIICAGMQQLAAVWLLLMRLSRRACRHQQALQPVG